MKDTSATSSMTTVAMAKLRHLNQGGGVQFVLPSLPPDGTLFTLQSISPNSGKIEILLGEVLLAKDFFVTILAILNTGWEDSNVL